MIKKIVETARTQYSLFHILSKSIVIVCQIRRCRGHRLTRKQSSQRGKRLTSLCVFNNKPKLVTLIRLWKKHPIWFRFCLASVSYYQIHLWMYFSGSSHGYGHQFVPVVCGC